MNVCKWDKIQSIDGYTYFQECIVVYSFDFRNIVNKGYILKASVSQVQL